ncbi:hypothetical protein GGS23DRAFT_447924 [Durotheca rogersii]|uniref:uncharacterized protein n=1 Tax=Durotheca rogersii TaxID=419775 RepID=UPI00221FFCE0|nr:uncharacterized protein GGS23DRAFT_447924 [Durotheca rogersii]KAI5864461.1 hypothetical protein GGS23DRAFT_447924 [Durotheca rogersii]
MATPTTPPTGPKAMSSRLLTMKFMQRAAALSSAPTNAQPTLEQASKRRKLDQKYTRRSNADSLVQIDQDAIKAALAEEERKRQEALLKHAAEHGDAHWILDILDKGPASKPDSHQTPLNLVQVGFAQIDSADTTGSDAELTDVEDDSAPVVKRYNMGNRQATKNSTPKYSDSDSDDSHVGPDYAAPMFNAESGQEPAKHRPETRPEIGSGPARAASRSKQGMERARAVQFAEKRRKKEVKLNDPKASHSGGLLSISSGGAAHRQPTALTCHRCGRPGHKQAECKNPQR